MPDLTQDQKKRRCCDALAGWVVTYQEGWDLLDRHGKAAMNAAAYQSIELLQDAWDRSTPDGSAETGGPSHG